MYNICTFKHLFLIMLFQKYYKAIQHILWNKYIFVEVDIFIAI